MDAVQTILNQTLQCFRIIIVNDDPEISLKELEKYPQVTVFDNPKRLGQAACYNKALELVDTPFVAFCGADDGYEPDRLEVIFKNEDWDFVYTDATYEYIDEKTGFPHFIPFESKELNLKLFRKNNFICHGTCAYRTVLVKKIKFDESLSYGEDKIFNAHVIMKAKRIKYIPKSTYLYRTYTSTAKKWYKNIPFINKKIRIRLKNRVARILDGEE